MPDTVGSLTGRAAGAACLILTLAGRAAAQQPMRDRPSTHEFLSRYDFHLVLAGLADEDDRFSWDGRVGAELDLVDYVVGRFSALAEYQVVMGNELRAFDANQGTYTLEAASSFRAASTEFAAVFHHVSRHLSDRGNKRAIAMNIFGSRVLRRIPLGAGTLDVWADLGRVVQHTYVDYTWRARVSLVARRPMGSRLGVFGRAFGETYGVNPQVAGRDGQHGGRVEGGLRLAGRAAAVELFAGYERVIDADPLDRQPRRWAFAGFRVIN
jgi:hypothetical protein